MRHHPVAIAGLILVVLGGGLYFGMIVGAAFRVGRQFSRVMPGSRTLGLAAMLFAAGKYWRFLAIALLGAVLLLVGR